MSDIQPHKPADGEDPAPTIRASDDEREDVVSQLAEHATTGRLTLAELDERVSQAYGATTRGELERVVADLPGPGVGTDSGAASAQVVPSSSRKASRWMVGIMGGSDRHGRWRAADRLNVVGIMGGHTVDFRNAELTSQETTVIVFSAMGGSDIIVPDSIDVEVGGFSIMGGTGEYGQARSPAPGAPRLRILVYNIMGGSDVWRVPEEARDMSVKQAKKLTKKR